MTLTKRILSGIRPTGPLHIGNYLGAIANWVEYQNQDTYYMIADWHVLTTEYDSGVDLYQNTLSVAVDLLACGLKPDSCTLFVQSRVPAHAELALILSMITPVSWLERNPTFKEQVNAVAARDLTTHGFLGYPVLQTADILLYDADEVPIGEDQLPHLELAREIVRRFNFIFGKIFKEPQPLLTKTPKLLGIDGRKMSKSYGNGIYFSDDKSMVEIKIKKMLTDPARKRRTDPGNPELCPVFAYHRIFSQSAIAAISAGCRSADIGCIDCKQDLLKSLVLFLEPFWERRGHYEGKPQLVKEVLHEGTQRAIRITTEKMIQVREVIKL